MKYTHKACILDGTIIETVIDLDKVVAIKKAGFRELSHKVFCAGLRGPVEVFDVPAVKSETAADYERDRAANYLALIEAWTKLEETT